MIQVTITIALVFVLLIGTIMFPEWQKKKDKKRK